MILELLKKIFKSSSNEPPKKICFVTLGSRLDHKERLLSMITKLFSRFGSDYLWVLGGKKDIFLS